MAEDEVGVGRWSAGGLNRCCRAFAVTLIKPRETKAKIKIAIVKFSAWMILRLVVKGGVPSITLFKSRAIKPRKG